jgi:Zn-dependent protease with chaperone function
MRTAKPLTLPGTSLPAFELDADAPLLALAGIVRPRLLVTRGLMAALTRDELTACVAHELAHFRSRDNFKRLAMRLAPDVLPLVGAAEPLEREWASAAEHRADRHASADDPQARCTLASALLKVARLTPPLAPAAEPLSTLVGGGDLASRIGRLLDERASSPRTVRRRLWLAGGLGAAGAAVVYTPLLYTVHEATEILIRYLP